MSSVTTNEKAHVQRPQRLWYKVLACVHAPLTPKKSVPWRCERMRAGYTTRKIFVAAKILSCRDVLPSQ